MYKGAFGQNGKKPKEYPKEIKTRAVELYHQCRGEFSSKQKTAQHIADLLGVGSYDSVLIWVKQSEIDSGLKEGLTSEEREEIRKLRREVAELKRTNGILRAASAFFASELDRPHTKW
jgi:transposase